MTKKQKTAQTRLDSALRRVQRQADSRPPTPAFSPLVKSATGQILRVMQDDPEEHYTCTDLLAKFDTMQYKTLLASLTRSIRSHILAYRDNNLVLGTVTVSSWLVRPPVAVAGMPRRNSTMYRFLSRFKAMPAGTQVSEKNTPNVGGFSDFFRGVIDNGLVEVVHQGSLRYVKAGPTLQDSTIPAAKSLHRLAEQLNTWSIRRGANFVMTLDQGEFLELRRVVNDYLSKHGNNLDFGENGKGDGSVS